MTKPTPNPILEKMARAICSIDMVRQPRYDMCTVDQLKKAIDREWRNHLPAAGAALRSLLPLDDRTIEIAHEAANKDNSGELDDDWATWGDIERALTAFINHTLGGKG